MQPGKIVDLFAGAGGWDEGLHELGYTAVGIDVDRWACATARAAGHERIEADIAALDPEDFAPVWGLIGSPPCQASSTAGKGLGRFDKERVTSCEHELAAGHDTRAEHLAACRDPRSLLTVEPLRWAVALDPAGSRWSRCRASSSSGRCSPVCSRPRLRRDRRGAERRAVRRAADPQAGLPGRLARRPGRAARPDPSLIQPASTRGGPRGGAATCCLGSAWLTPSTRRGIPSPSPTTRRRVAADRRVSAGLSPARPGRSTQLGIVDGRASLPKDGGTDG